MAKARRRVENGKKVYTWDLRIAPAGDIKVDVYLISSLHASSSFKAFCDAPRVQVEARDLPELRKKITEAVREAYAVVWTPTLVVDVGISTHHYRGVVLDRGVGVLVRTLELATIDGVQWQRQSAGMPMTKGWPETGVRSGSYAYDGQGGLTTTRLLPDTEENRAALAALASAFATLEDRLHALFDETRIEATLGALRAGVLLLPSGGDT